MFHKLGALLMIFLTGATVHTMSQAHTEQREVPKEIRSRLFKQALADSGERECFEKEEGGMRAAEENMSVTEVDVNRDGVSEYEVELSGPCTCGMVNCSIFLYRQSVTGYELILDGAAGLLLPGGGDIDPAWYGREPHPRTQHVNHRRDRFELTHHGAGTRGELELPDDVQALVRSFERLGSAWLPWP